MSILFVIFLHQRWANGRVPKLLFIFSNNDFNFFSRINLDLIDVFIKYILLPSPDNTWPFPFVEKGSMAITSPYFNFVLLRVFATFGIEIPECSKYLSKLCPVKLSIGTWL